MKISMKVTGRDRKLLSFLMILLIGIGLYIFVLNPLYLTMSEESTKNMELSKRYSELKGYEKDLKINKEKYEKQKLEYMTLSKEIPPNLSEKYVISDMYKISNEVSAEALNYKFSKREEIKDDLYTKEGNKGKGYKGVYKYSASTSWLLGYSDLKKLINISKTYENVFNLNDISILPTVDGRLEASFNVDFIGYDDEKSPLRVWNGLNLKPGKGEIFTKALSENVEGVGTVYPIDKNNSTGGSNTTISTNNNITSIDKNKDFVVVLSTTASPTSSVVMEKIGEGKSIFGRNKNVENVVIDISGKDNKYKYSMSTGSEKDPTNGQKDLKPNGSDIVVVVYSVSRKGDDDKNIVNININNQSDKKVYVYVVGDDEKLPRCSITKGGSNVYVEKR